MGSIDRTGTIIMVCTDTTRLGCSGTVIVGKDIFGAFPVLPGTQLQILMAGPVVVIIYTVGEMVGLQTVFGVVINGSVCAIITIVINCVPTMSGHSI